MWCAILVNKSEPKADANPGPCMELMRGQWPEGAAEPAQWLVWRLEETLPQLLDLLPLDPAMYTGLKRVHHPDKQRQYIAARLALRTLLDLPTTVAILRQPSGAPRLSSVSHHVSLTHTHGYVAAMAHPSRPVGLDLETRHRPRNPETRHLFMNKQELAEYEARPDILRFLLVWSAKEALYKLYNDSSRGVLSFKEHLHIPLPPNALPPRGVLPTEVSLNGTPITTPLGYEITPDLVITWAISPLPLLQT